MDERSAERLVTDREVTCFFRGIPTKAFMYDLSVDGCMVDGLGASIAEGDVLSLKFEEEIGAKGQVVWQRNGCAGIHFFESVHPVIVQYLGFRRPAEAFETKLPRDRFGRLLEALPIQEVLFSSSSKD